MNSDVVLRFRSGFKMRTRTLRASGVNNQAVTMTRQLATSESRQDHCRRSEDHHTPLDACSEAQGHIRNEQPRGTASTSTIPLFLPTTGIAALHNDACSAADIVPFLDIRRSGSFSHFRGRLLAAAG